MEATERVPSDAVMILDPAIFKEMLKVPTPLTRVAEAGSPALGSLEVMTTVPEWPVAVLPAGSLAVTVNEREFPATVEAGTDPRTRLLAVPEATVTIFESEMDAEDTAAPKLTEPVRMPVNEAV